MTRLQKFFMGVGVCALALFCIAAVTPNSIVTTQTVSTITFQIATGDQTTPASLCAAGANGTKIFDVLVNPDTDGTGANREVSLYMYDGSNSRLICTIDITADDAAPIVPVSLFSSLTLPVDSNGDKFLEIPSGYSLYISAENVAATTPVHVLKQDY
jgi:hypothetical protein